MRNRKKQALKEAKEAMRHRQREYNREKREMRKRIAKRPLLIEGETKASEKTRTTLQKIRETMEKSGMHDIAQYFNSKVFIKNQISKLASMLHHRFGHWQIFTFF